MILSICLQKKINNAQICSLCSLLVMIMKLKIGFERSDVLDRVFLSIIITLKYTNVRRNFRAKLCYMAQWWIYLWLSTFRKVNSIKDLLDILSMYKAICRTFSKVYPFGKILQSPITCLNCVLIHFYTFILNVIKPPYKIPWHRRTNHALLTVH